MSVSESQGKNRYELMMKGELRLTQLASCAG